ncbi:MAG: diguanylate cyclase [Planctomycetota bacterium]|nr:MAG: diguanylate cyclase [Planctomycetota bacterium]
MNKPSQKKETLKYKLQNLRQKLLLNLSTDLKKILSLWKTYIANTSNLQALENIYQWLLPIITQSSELGLDKICYAAHNLEIHLKILLRKKVSPTHLQISQIAYFFQTLFQNRGDFSAPSSSSPTFQKQLNSIYLLSEDTLLGEEISWQVSHFGYHTKIFQKIENLEKEFLHSLPNFLICDTLFFQKHNQSFLTLSQILEKIKPIDSAKKTKLIFIDQNGNTQTRLEAVQLGAEAFLQKPLDYSELVDVLDQLHPSHSPLKPRVAILDNNLQVATQYQQTLQEAGMLAQILNPKEEIVEKLLEFQPDLILLDMFLPPSGLDIARMLRQHSAFVSLPLVFTSTQNDLEKQILALEAGGDYVLYKPISPQYLVPFVRCRVEHNRRLRSLMLKDSLTGLFNHTAFHEQLAREVSLARRLKQPLTLAMLDLDYFKSINDQYGHPTGDRVLKVLARMLKQRLRKSDIVGRYGGEEFAVALPQTSLENATKIFEEIRLAFSYVQHTYQSNIFQSTFSCGLAELQNSHTILELCEAADQALYQAKRKGRNRICLNPSK